MQRTLVIPLALAALACQSTRSPAWRAVDGRSGNVVSFERMADELSKMDVVFLGEVHDNEIGHELQLAMTRALHERVGRVAVSLEMIERDCQLDLDLYLSGRIDEADFVERSRPWTNYYRDYRPVVELARREGLPVIAGNVPRALARRVARAGLGDVARELLAPREVLPEPGPYRERFEAVMGGHGGMQDAVMDRVFASQVIKDEAMAESIADHLERAPGTLVVHWVGRFHSDHHLGTVECLRRRIPGLRVGVVSMLPGTRNPRKITPEQRSAGDFLWLVRN